MELKALSNIDDKYFGLYKLRKIDKFLKNDFLEKHLDDIKKSIETILIKFLDQVDKNWKLHNFDQACKLKDHFISIKNCLKNVFYEESQTIERRFNEINEEEFNYKESFKKEFLNKSIFDYKSIKPKDKIAKLKENEEVFSDLIETFNLGIEKNFNIELEDIKKNWIDKYHEKDILIEKIKLSLEYVPDDLKNNFLTQIEQTKKEIQLLEETNKKNFENNVKNKEFYKLINFYGVKKPLFNEYDKIFQTEFEETNLKILGCIENFKFNQGFSELFKLKEYCDNNNEIFEKYGRYLKDLKSKYNNCLIDMKELIEYIVLYRESNKGDLNLVEKYIKSFIEVHEDYDVNIMGGEISKCFKEILEETLLKFFKRKEDEILKIENIFKQIPLTNNTIGKNINDLLEGLSHPIIILSAISKIKLEKIDKNYQELKTLINRYLENLNLDKIRKKFNDLIETEIKEFKNKLSNIEIVKDWIYDNKKKEIVTSKLNLLKKIIYFESDSTFFDFKKFKVGFEKDINDLKYKTNKDINDCLGILKNELIYLEKSNTDIDNIKEAEIRLKLLDFLEKNIILEKSKDGETNEQIKKSLKQICDNLDINNTDKTEKEQAKILIKIKEISNHFITLENFFDEFISNFLKSISKNNLTINNLGLILNSNKFGKEIVNNYDVFYGINFKIFNDRIGKYDIEEVLKRLDDNNADKSKLKKHVDLVDKIYNKYVEEYIIGDNDINIFLQNFNKLIPNTSEDRFTSIMIKIPELIASIFFYWTFTESRFYKELRKTVDKKDEEINNYLRKPHPVQIIALLRIFGLGSKTESLSNILIEVGTGEGKSIILGVSSIIFALADYEVYCACYSKYLSQRDNKSFEKIFEYFKVREKIHFGTFNELCERKINENDNIRSSIEYLFENNILQYKDRIKKEQIKKKRILLIDEVDVFFGSDFYGNIYSISANIRHSTVNSLLDYLWKNREKILMSDLLISEKYLEFEKYISNFNSLSKSIVSQMLYDLKNFDKTRHTMYEGKIGYMLSDEFDEKVFYGYSTIFAYFYEFYTNESIDEDTLNKKKMMLIDCCSFSYAEIATTEFDLILGVSGTVNSLTYFQKKIIKEEFKIDKISICPRVYPSFKLKYDKSENINILKKIDYHRFLINSIENGMKGKHYDNHERAVLVFFKDKQFLDNFIKLDDFKKSKYGKRFNILHEAIEEGKRDNTIKISTYSGSLTFLTKSFGRGLDFISRDNKVYENGGIHVIQTFLSLELSEEVQIKGRTARQGEEGSYELILLEDDLEEFNISKEEIENYNNKKDKLYDELLNVKRNNKFKISFEETKKDVKSIKHIHEKSKNFQDYLYNYDLLKVKEHILSNHNFEQLFKLNNQSNCTMILMDATGSMSSVIQNTKNKISEMFDRINTILKEKNRIVMIEICLVAYRCYCASKDEVLQISKWSVDPKELRDFLNNVSF